jgi:hypothetical protein
MRHRTVDGIVGIAFCREGFVKQAVGANAVRRLIPVSFAALSRLLPAGFVFRSAPPS